MTVVNKGLPVLEKHVTQEQVIRYAEASGDHNPIHLDPNFAAKTTFGRPIAHGMLILAFLSEMLTIAYGRFWLEGGSLKVRFKAPVYIGETVTTSGSLKSEIETAYSRRFIYRVGCSTQEGNEVITGEATVDLPKKEQPGE